MVSDNVYRLVPRPLSMHRDPIGNRRKYTRVTSEHVLARENHTWIQRYSAYRITSRPKRLALMGAQIYGGLASPLDLSLREPRELLHYL